MHMTHYINIILKWKKRYFNLKEFNIDKPNLPMEQDVVEYAEKIKNTKTEEIKQELINYIETAFRRIYE